MNRVLRGAVCASLAGSIARSRRFGRLTMFIGLLGLIPSFVRAQTPDPVAPSPVPQVKGLNGHLELGYVVQVEITHLADWAETHDTNRLVPFINGRAVRGCYPIEVHTRTNHVSFELQITPESRDMWIDLLGAPQALRTTVAFSAGLEGGTPFPTTLEADRAPTLTVIAPIYGLISLTLIVMTVFGFVYLARNTDLLRDPGPPPPPGGSRRYNLGRVQMAFWFFLTYVSYIVIWLITDAIDTITPALLALMGISAATALGEVVIDSNKDATNRNQLAQARAEKQALDQTVSDSQTQLASLTTKAAPTGDDVAAADAVSRQLLDQRVRSNQLGQQIANLTSSTPSGLSRGFLQDLLSDRDGYSFHRFQMVAWTVVLGGVFISAVYNTLTMPEFSATMLGLMGMSSGTYIGFKFPEQR